MFGLGSLLGAPNEVHCVACGARYARTAWGAPAPAAVRECPHCKHLMNRGESECPHCRVESKPWTFHAGVWWVQGESGEWQWLDEGANIFRWYKDGTASSPGASDKAPNLLIDPAVISPPDAREMEATLPTAATASVTGELERLTELHARGALSDEQFEAAKSRLLGL